MLHFSKTYFLNLHLFQFSAEMKKNLSPMQATHVSRGLPIAYVFLLGLYLDGAFRPQSTPNGSRSWP